MTNTQDTTGRTQLIDVDAYRDTECQCWVSKAPGWVQFGLHFGAHSLTCPRYRVSLDPVDRANDEEQRRHGEQRAIADALWHKRQAICRTVDRDDRHDRPHCRA